MQDDDLCAVYLFAQANHAAAEAARYRKADPALSAALNEIARRNREKARAAMAAADFAERELNRVFRGPAPPSIRFICHDEIEAPRTPWPIVALATLAAWWIARRERKGARK